MNKELVEKLEKLGLTPGKALEKAKRRYRDAKLVRTYSNRIERAEQVYFKEDEYIIERVIEIERLNEEIIQHFDLVLDQARNNPIPEVSAQEKVRQEVAERTVN